MKFLSSVTILLCVAFVNRSQTFDYKKDMEREQHTIKNVYAKFPLDEHPPVAADTNLIAIWKMKEDVDKHNYFVLERSDPNEFVFTYMNREGSNRTYENVGAFFSKVGNATFLNVRFYDWDSHKGGWFFLKVTDLDPKGWSMSLSLVADTTLKEIPTAQGVRDRIAKNVDNPAYFKPPVHFRKILPLMYCK